MSDTDDKPARIVPAKVHGDSGVTSVEADTEDMEVEDIEATEDAQVSAEEKAQPAGNFESGMRS